ncbi:SdpI family protein [Glutamicibacter sp. ZJUTW]|uniref:SdpI family protein n=1 Tax=Glutamicibacter sp. ZJUTW TaxID=1155384 RepID=UPI0011F232D3|nr:SdpI family protein [Glutamicibacter sp. ZJUTW]QEP08589.1 SdpI family protein [Glutamicibacter sp. ZJUTW]
MDPASVISFMFGLLAITLVAALLAPMARDGKLARNAAIGIRTRHTLASNEAWLAGHRRAAPLVAAASWAGWAMLSGAAILCVLGQFGFAFATTGAGYLAIIVLLMVSAAKANQAARGI